MAALLAKLPALLKRPRAPGPEPDLRHSSHDDSESDERIKGRGIADVIRSRVRQPMVHNAARAAGGAANPHGPATIALQGATGSAETIPDFPA